MHETRWSRAGTALRVLIGILALCAPCGATGVYDGAWDQYESPEAAGWSSEGVDAAHRHAGKVGSDAVLLVHDGHVVTAWGEIDRRFKCHSMRKSFLSALYGVHVDAGRIDPETTLRELEIDDVQGLSRAEKKARIVDLLRARSGIYHPAAYEPASMQRNRPQRGSARVGRRWFYNNWDFNTLATIFNRVTGTDLFEEFERCFARPLGMEDFSRERDTFYWLEPSRSLHPAYLFRLSARDAARFGLLFLENGEWNGRRILSDSWVKESTSPQTPFDNGEDGYGYMWWFYGKSEAPRSEAEKYDTFVARGTGAQLILVCPEIDLVYVHRSDTDNTAGVGTGDAMRVAQMLLEARTVEPAEEPEFTPVKVRPLPGAQPPPPARKAIPLPDDLRQELPGTYVVAPQLRAVMHLHEGRLFLRMEGAVEAEVELLPEDGTTLFNAAAGITVRLKRDEKGRVREIDTTVGADRFLGKRMD